MTRRVPTCQDVEEFTTPGLFGMCHLKGAIRCVLNAFRRKCPITELPDRMLTIQASMLWQETSCYTSTSNILVPLTKEMRDEFTSKCNSFTTAGVAHCYPGRLIIEDTVDAAVLHCLGGLSSYNADAVKLLFNYVNKCTDIPTDIIIYLSVCYKYSLSLNKYLCIDTRPSTTLGHGENETPP